MLKIILIILVILLTLVVVIPFVLSIVGVNIIQFGAVGGVPGSKSISLLRSSDGGEIWENISVAENKQDSFPQQIFSLALHPLNPDLLMLGSKGAGLWKSINGGNTWTRVSDKAGVLGAKGDVYKAVFSPSSPDILYVVSFENSRGRILRSDDAGRSFREIYFVPANRYVVSDVAVSQADADWVRISTGQGGVLESKNGGKTWRVLEWFSEALSMLVQNPAFPSEMYVVTASGKVSKTTDAGVNWTWLNISAVSAQNTDGNQVIINPYQSVETPRFFSFGARTSLETLTMDPNSPAVLYAGLGEGLLRSQNGGSTWERLNLLIPPEALAVSAVAIFPKNSNRIFAGVGAELHLSQDGGVDWSVKTLPTTLRIKIIAIQPLKPTTMYVVGRK